MVAVITWLEALVRDHIYRDAALDLTRSMSLPQNVCDYNESNQRWHC